jgi:hypothetical protein
MRSWEPIKNPEGVTLRPYGLQTCEAKWLYFVCFDNFPGVGGFMHCMPVTLARQAVEKRWQRGEQVKFGSSMRNPGNNTGAGYRITPVELEARAFALSGDGGKGTLKERSERLASEMMTEWGNPWRKATMDEQLRGIDFVSLAKPDRRLLASLRGDVQVKARGSGKWYPELFIQTHEYNPLGLHD